MSEHIDVVNDTHLVSRVSVSGPELRGMITLRGTLSSPAVKQAVKNASGAGMPKTRGIVHKADISVAWMSPDELLILCPYDQTNQLTATLQAALSNEHALVVNVSDARVIFSLTGADIRAVLAKLAPVDFSPDVFVPGQIKRTRLAQTAAAIWMSGKEEAQLICFRAVADYVFDLLKNASAS